MIKLARSPIPNEWAVLSDTDFTQFPSVELATGYLESILKVKDEEIDEALVHIAALNKNVAVFDDNGMFIEVRDF